MAKDGKKSPVEAFSSEAERKQRRKITGRREKGKSPWFWFGMMGTVGWSVAIPAVVGTLIGVWIDKRFGGTKSWALMGLAAGMTLGILVAWGWVKQSSEIDKNDKERRK
ncbi:MAG: AtpZ/AtpI family protein [Candidatus Sumerlaeota bacterium]